MATENPSNGGANPTLSVRLLTINSSEFFIQVTNSMPVPTFKQKVQEVTGVLIDRQRLIFQGKVLTNDKCISNYPIKDGMTVHVVERRVLPAAAGTSSSSSRSETESSAENRGLANQSQDTPSLRATLRLLDRRHNAPRIVVQRTENLRARRRQERGWAQSVARHRAQESRRRANQTSSDQPVRQPAPQVSTNPFASIASLVDRDNAWLQNIVGGVFQAVAERESERNSRRSPGGTNAATTNATRRTSTRSSRPTSSASTRQGTSLNVDGSIPSRATSASSRRRSSRATHDNARSGVTTRSRASASLNIDPSRRSIARPVAAQGTSTSSRASSAVRGSRARPTPTRRERMTAVQRTTNPVSLHPRIHVSLLTPAGFTGLNRTGGSDPVEQAYHARITEFLENELRRTFPTVGVTRINSQTQNNSAQGSTSAQAATPPAAQRTSVIQPSSTAAQHSSSRVQQSSETAAGRFATDHEQSRTSDSASDQQNGTSSGASDQRNGTSSGARDQRNGTSSGASDQRNGTSSGASDQRNGTSSGASDQRNGTSSGASSSESVNEGQVCEQLSNLHNVIGRLGTGSLLSGPLRRVPGSPSFENWSACNLAHAMVDCSTFLTRFSQLPDNRRSSSRTEIAAALRQFSNALGTTASYLEQHELRENRRAATVSPHNRTSSSANQR